MAFIEWNDDFKIGIASIDEQHEWLVDTTNKLYEACNGTDPDDCNIGEILEGLVDYTFNHFILEEELFARHGYPETAAHKAEHDRFTKLATELLDKHENGAMVGNDVLEFLKNWLKHHILEVDKAYVPFMQEKGVT